MNKQIQISPENIAAVLDRYDCFYDSVVKKIELCFLPEKACTLLIECIDKESDNGWGYVLFEISGVKEFKLQYGKTIFEVLSSGVQFFWRDGKILIFFDAYPDDEGMPDLSTNTAYFVGEKCVLTESKGSP